MKKISEVQAKLLSIIAAVLVWQIAAAMVHNHILVASPLAVFHRFLTIWNDPDFLAVLAFSFSRIVIGFLAALVIGLILGILSARFRLVEILLWPYTVMIKAIPVASFIIIALIWMRGGQLSIFIAFLMVFPIVYSNVLEGMKSTDPKMLEMASVFHMPYSRRMHYLYLPALRPYLTAACRTGTDIAWKSGIAAEVIGIANGSIGEKLYESKIYFQTEDLFVWTLLIVLCSVVFEKIIALLLHLFYRKLYGV